MQRFSFRGALAACVGVFCVAVCVGLVGAGLAGAVVAGPGWTIESFAAPSSFSVGDNARCVETAGKNAIPSCDYYRVTARNQGSLGTVEGARVSLSEVLPEGLSVEQIRLVWPAVAKLFGLPTSASVFQTLEGIGLFFPEDGKCSISGTTQVSLDCSVNWEKLAELLGQSCGGGRCSDAPDEEIELFSFVTVDEPGEPRSLTNTARVEGGGALAAETVGSESGNEVGGAAGFGFSHFGFYVAGADGARDVLAGDHPYELKVTVGFHTATRVGPDGVVEPDTPEDVRDVVTDLPVGFVGSILAAPECSFAQLSSHIEAGKSGCPPDTIVGHISTEPGEGYLASVNGAIYNMTPERGVPAEFAYVDNLAGAHVFYSRVVPTPRGYVLQTVNPEIPDIRLRSVVVTFFGDPEQRDAEEVAKKLEEESGKPVEPQATFAPPFFTNPTDCGGEEPTATIYADSWQHPARFNQDGTPVDLEEGAWAKLESKSPPVTGCDALQFPAEVKAQTTTHEADKPTGLDFEVKVPQPEAMGVRGTPTLKKVVVRLPEGLTVDPSAGSGLGACSEAQIGWTGPGRLDFNAAAPGCPEASKIGSLELESPLVPHSLTGEMFLARQDENPFNTTLAAYVVVHDPVTGVLIKIAGEFLPSHQTGRLESVFDENPNLPFSDLKLHFFGGPRAELATPESCGVFATESELFPWSFPDSGPPTLAMDSFLINEACPNNAFSPSFTAGSTNLQAGAYTPFVASFERSDTDQELSGLTVTLPPGLLGKTAGVPLCTDEDIHAIQASKPGHPPAGECPQASQVGTVLAAAGPGPDPFFTPGKAYLTGPYNGGPYGLAVVVPAVAGPFNFGTVVVRQSLRIDPRTAQITDVSDSFPKIIDGIPLRIRRVDVHLDRPEFTFNPTNCEPLAFNGTLTGSPLGAPTQLNPENGILGYASSPGSTSAFSTPFEVTNCATLKYTPQVAVSTKAQASKADGAALTFKISYPKNAIGQQTWIREAKFDLPKQLPARLETLQKACLSTTFETDRAACPPASIIGNATVHTPVLPEPLTGPVYFVSYGGQKFPEAVIVLQGDNITFNLHGETFIDNKTGVTSATFPNTPDVPFESIEVNIPTGRYSEFGANLPNKAKYNFCGQTLNMPTLLKAQNGQEIHQTTHITITGCHPKHHPKHNKKKPRNTHRKHH